MTHQKSIPTDSHFRHNPSTDHPAHLHTQGNIRSTSAGRGRETIGDGRCSGQSSRRKLNENNTGKTNATEAIGLMMNQDLRTSPQAFEKLDRQHMTCETLEEYLSPSLLDRLRLSRSDLQSLWNASIDPPVTRASLSELDLERISNDPKLRQDVNFDREVSFRPNLQGETGRQKLALAKGYWDALVIEFQLYISRRRKLFSQGSGTPMRADSPWLLGPATAAKVPLRLPRMFQVISEILKTLVPESEWVAVDARLDVELLIQELENGVCDIVALSQWLGDLLQGSCSPMRDSSVQASVSMIQKGVEKESSRIIVAGIKSLFGILETMKLDVANHQIRTLRLLMIEDYVQFQQKIFLCRIPREPHLRSAYSWFYVPDATTEVQVKRAYTPRIQLFLRGVVDLVTTISPDLPSTFEYDFERLGMLQIDFQTCLMQAACHRIFINTLHSLGWRKISLPDRCNNLMNHVSIFATSPRRHEQLRYVKDIALEIVREAYKACSIEGLPDDAVLAETEQMLCEAWNPSSSIFQSQARIIGNELNDLVGEAVESVTSLAPLQILDHLNPVPPESDLEPEPEHERGSLLNIARRIAHIAVLHWRVWAPILYQQPWGSV